MTDRVPGDQPKRDVTPGPFLPGHAGVPRALGPGQRTVRATVSTVAPMSAGRRSSAVPDGGEWTRPSVFRDVSISDRQRLILKLIVQEHVQSGRPVGSKALTEKYVLGFSSATIRNEMSELESAGFIQSLHTSGGRVPTDLGYRYFVHMLMDTPELPSGDQIMIRHQFRQVEAQLEQWVELAAVVLAETARSVSVVTAPRPAVARLRHLELISLQPRLALLILVTQDSMVRQVMLRWPEDTDQPALSQLADELVGQLSGMTVSEVRDQVGRSSGAKRFVIERIAATLGALDAVEQVEIRHSGLENVLTQPEFAGAESQALLEILRGGGFLSALLPQVENGSGVQVFIGDENPTSELRRFGVVLATYGVGGEVSGLLGVLGPTRMAYGRSISSVRYMAQLMSGLVADLYGGQSPTMNERFDQ
ncbi:MAG TPA: heat-inducible transcriptional repressor HrcA [Thermomicrobiales bacterium]|nr:heat-inducible transcriptional repressor HrcA [Thermomicrobiales bacterium]